MSDLFGNHIVGFPHEAAHLMCENALLWILNPHVIVTFPGSFIPTWFSQCLKHVLSQSGLHLSHVMRNSDFCLCQKGADQLHSNCEADQCLCIRYTDSTIILLLQSEISSFVSELV